MSYVPVGRNNPSTPPLNPTLKYPTIGSAITIIGNDENEIANNQYFVNALGGVYDDANFEIVYDGTIFHITGMFDTASSLAVS